MVDVNIILARSFWCYDMGIYPDMIFVNDFDVHIQVMLIIFALNVNVN